MAVIGYQLSVKNKDFEAKCVVDPDEKEFFICGFFYLGDSCGKDFFGVFGAKMTN
jgi:hypothetical protein